MDITLIQVTVAGANSHLRSFNPCFNGYYTYTVFMPLQSNGLVESFNPCFNGYYTYTKLQYA